MIFKPILAGGNMNENMVFIAGMVYGGAVLFSLQLVTAWVRGTLEW